ncbi:hypothetical protein [Algoriphagus sp.]|uniref:hypothetical protein n=1 Tax=Algoriphagus sp. TaxID=1872435 RepID=UPI003F71A307
MMDVNRIYIVKYIVLMLILISCDSRKEDNASTEENSSYISLYNSLIIVFNAQYAETEFIDRSTSEKQSFQYWREGFYDPNLHINVFHGLGQARNKISRRNLDKTTVWFDSEMEYTDWFNLNFDKYYIILQDEYLVKGSLDPDHEFDVYEVGISTGGVE